MEKDSLAMELARKHYDSYLKNDPEYSSFEDWFKDCAYNMSVDYYKDGVEYVLGELKYNGKFEQYMEDIKFNDFLNDMEYSCQVKFNYSDGRGPGYDIYSMLIDPNVKIYVDLLGSWEDLCPMENK